MATTKDPADVVEIDRIEATGFRELLWSDGWRLRFSTFCELKRPALTTAERAARRQCTRLRKRARRRKGERLKAALAAYRKRPPP
jgi:hypothetical protein